MFQTELLKKYLKPILYIILTVIILVLAYKIFTRLRGGANAVGGVIADVSENTVIATQTQIPVKRVQELRQIAFELSNELETNKDLTWTYTWFNMTTVYELEKIINKVKSSNEMIVVKNFYNSEFTNKSSLYEDLKKAYTSFDFATIPFVEALY